MRTKITVLYILLAGGNLLAWAWEFIALHDYPVRLGTAFLAYTFGLRHAVDADHIAAVDNVTRKLMQEGERPTAVGFFFSLGHSTVVVVASAAIARAPGALKDHFVSFRAVGGVVGTLVSAFFFFWVAAANLVILHSVHRTFQEVRRGGKFVEEDLNHLLAQRGLSRGLPSWSIMVFPALFMAGMSLIDTTDDVLMLGAYGWAFVKPVRKLYYNLTISFISVFVAIVIGSIEVLGLASNKLNLSGPSWNFVSVLNDNFGSLGYVVIAIFVVTWVISIFVYQINRYDTIEARRS
jgi:high-affinity nickel-transport protein